jgi:hypothetical protein
MTAPEEGVAVADDPGQPAAPATGVPAIDDALQSLPGLQSTPLAEHHDRLARAHEALHVALERSGEEPDSG